MMPKVEAIPNAASGNFSINSATPFNKIDEAPSVVLSPVIIACTVSPLKSSLNVLTFFVIMLFLIL